MIPVFLYVNPLHFDFEAQLAARGLSGRRILPFKCEGGRSTPRYERVTGRKRPE
jgi:hypothetical protein